MELTPNAGTQGRSILVTGSDFEAGVPVTSFTFNGVTPSSQDCTSQTTVPIPALNAGEFSCTFNVPDDPPSSVPYTVEATAGGGTGMASFTITPYVATPEFPLGTVLALLVPLAILGIYLATKRRAKSVETDFKGFKI